QFFGRYIDHSAILATARAVKGPTGAGGANIEFIAAAPGGFLEGSSICWSFILASLPSWLTSATDQLALRASSPCIAIFVVDSPCDVCAVDHIGWAGMKAALRAPANRPAYRRQLDCGADKLS